MRWLKPYTALALLLFAGPARAQDAAPQPTVPPPPPAQPPPPPPPPAPAQVYDGEQPPSPVRPALVPARRRPPVEEPKEVATTGFGLEFTTAGFASGNVQGGVLLGAHTPAGAIFGMRFNYRDETTRVSSSSSSATAFALGVAGRFPVAGSQEGLDLAMAVDAAFLKVETPDAVSGASGSKGSGFQFAFGPQLRYWLHPNVAVGYMGQLSYAKISSDNSDSSSKVEQSVTAIVGTFTLTAGF
jgi:hypothetical protein